MRELHLFAGAGGGILAGILLGHRCVCAVEIEDYRRRVLLQRQRDGVLPWFPIWDDVRTFDGTEWRGRVDVVCGGFPCQDISIAGRGVGIEGKRSGLWGEMARIIGEVRPGFVFVENSPELVVRGLGRVVGDLAGLGYQCRWGVLGGYTAGLCADGKRLWLVAHATNRKRWFTPEVQSPFAHPEESCRWQFERAVGACLRSDADATGGRNSDEVARNVERCSAIGDGQVPAVAALAWNTLTEGIL